MDSYSQSPTDDGFVQDPYPFYARMRESGDLAYWSDLDIACATSHQAVSRLLRHPDLGRQRPEGVLAPARADNLDTFYWLEDNSLLDLEPPRHTRLKRLVSDAFNPNRVAMHSPAISATIDALIDAFPSGPFDLTEHFTRKLPVIVIARLLGVPEDMAPQFLAWSNAIVAMYQSRRNAELEREAEAAAKAFVAYLRDHIAEHRRRPGHDLLTELIAANAGGDSLSDDELISTIILILNAGHEATVNALGIGVKTLLETQTPHDKLQPVHILRTVNEILRFDAPLHMFRRYVYKPVDLYGQHFLPGDEIALLLAAANRDATIWEEADRFDPLRKQATNSSFGGGIHFCLGAPLARIELQVAFPVLFARLPGLRLTEPPRFANTWHFRGLERLMVEA